MRSIIQSLLSIAATILIPSAFAQTPEPSSVRLAIRDACVTKVAAMSASTFAKSSVSPGFFCTCVANGHNAWANEDIGETTQAAAYLRAILALYRPTTTADSDRARRRFPSEYDNDMNIASNCFQWPAGNGRPRVTR